MVNQAAVAADVRRRLERDRQFAGHHTNARRAHRPRGAYSEIVLSVHELEAALAVMRRNGII